MGTRGRTDTRTIGHIQSSRDVPIYTVVAVDAVLGRVFVHNDRQQGARKPARSSSGWQFKFRVRSSRR